MAGIYIHIPFCRRKCHYCNFFSVASLRAKTEFVDSLLREISAQRNYLNGETVRTIYFGGGTPSLLTTGEIELILEKIYDLFPVDQGAEITLEANPDDLSRDRAAELFNTPVNRLSIGVQSFFDDDLAYLNRVHSAGQALQAVDHARAAGFRNLTIDLIYGIPTLTEEKWRYNLEKFFSLDIPHLSAYSLTVEKKTALDLLIRKGKYAPPDERQAVRHFQLLLEASRAANFIHYEISNFSLEGYYSRHNSLYWLGGNYLGLGPSAHSFNGYSRHWNISSIREYIQSAENRTVVEEKEILTPTQRYNEYVMTSIRTIWGCDTEHIRNVFGEGPRAHFLAGVDKYLERKHLYRSGSTFYLTDEGKLFADGIAADLFLEG